MNRILVTAACITLVALTSCGRSFSQPEHAVRTFLDCMSDRDMSGARDCLVSHEQAIAQLTPPTGPVEYEIGMAVIQGQHARVPVVVVEGTKRTSTHWITSRAGGDWRISIGMTVAKQMHDGVEEQMNELEDGASDEERVEALRRGMQGAAPGR